MADVGEKLWTLAELAAEHGLTVSRVRQLCTEGRFPGAAKVGTWKRGLWLVPDRDVRFWLEQDRDRRYKGKVPK